MAAPQPVTALERPRDGAMDRRIERRRFTWPRAAAALIAVGLASVLVQQLLATSGVRSFAVASELLTVGTVQNGVFLDFIPIRGGVQPLKTVYLDAIEGGRVEAVFVDEGDFVEEGQPILELSNTTLQLDVISREAQVSEQLNNLRNTRLAMEQNRLALRSALVEIDYQITRLTRLAKRRAELFERDLISRHDYEETLDELDYYRHRRDVTIESQEADERMRLAQIDSLEQSVEQLERNLDIARANLENLVIRAPMTGQLTALDAEIGESKARGQRLGQIDDVDDFKVTALVDEFYVTRARAGQRAEFELAGRTHPLEVVQVYPQIRDGQFQIDLAFSHAPPANLRRGQTLQIRLALGDSAEALLLPRGGFFQDTGGNWAFVLDPSGSFAEKRNLRLGRRNPEYFEVLDGLGEGDRVITSSYASYVDMDRIVLRE